MGAAGIVYIGALAVVLQCGTPHDPLVLRVESVAAVPETEMRLAQREASRIFQAADVSLVFQLERAADPTPFATIRVLSGAIADRLVPRSEAGRARLALAIPVAQRAYVHYPRIVAVARRSYVDPGTLLGRVIAHELVHILLRVHDHATSGLMAAEMNPGSTLPLLSSQEITGLQERIADIMAARDD